MTNEARIDYDLLANYDYELPEAQIAHEPAHPRDHARLLTLGRDGTIEHRHFYELPDLLRPDDVLVYNETRVVKARLRGIRPSGGRVEILVLTIGAANLVHALIRPAKRLPVGSDIVFGEVRARVAAPEYLQFPPDLDLAAFLEASGEVPLPPYIHAPEHLDTAQAYQPIFARVAGSVAAPTASLHFTGDTIHELRARGITLVPLVLTVGLGTFAPVRSDRLSEHTMHEELYDIPQSTVDAIRAARISGRRIVAIGTTVMRALEGAARQSRDGELAAGSGATSLFVKPGFTFRVVDALITNFHVPRSTLLVLVSTFAGYEHIRRAYAQAIRLGYRFFSFGDAMLLERVT